MLVAEVSYSEDGVILVFVITVRNGCFKTVFVFTQILFGNLLTISLAVNRAPDVRLYRMRSKQWGLY